MTRCLAVIPARGGSKGLPGKNTKPLAGLPLLVHSLRCAALVPAFSRVIVSTDDPAIAAVAQAEGGVVPFVRPAALARDDTPMMPVLAHALQEMEARDGVRYDLLALLDPTSPGRHPKDIEAAFALLGSDADAVGAVTCSRPRFNPFWVGVVERQGYLAPAFSGGEAYERRQDVPDFLRINGAFYLWRRDFVLAVPERWLSARHRAVVIPDERAFSIDDAFELALAELMITHGLVRLPWLTQEGT